MVIAWSQLPHLTTIVIPPLNQDRRAVEPRALLRSRKNDWQGCGQASRVTNTLQARALGLEKRLLPCHCQSIVKTETWGCAPFAWQLPGDRPKSSTTRFRSGYRGCAYLVGNRLGLRQIRRELLSEPIHRWAGDVLPKISKTERDAIEAGDISWDIELFTGTPDWKTLLDTPTARLSPVEQAFLLGPVQELRRMLDEWEIQFEWGPTGPTFGIS